MNRLASIRLIPIVLFATAALLVLKIVSGLTGIAFVTTNPPAAHAAGGHGPPPPPAAAPEVQERPKEQSEPPLKPKTSQNAVNERLGERRQQLDERGKELDQREALLKAAEKKLQERVDQLKQLEKQIDQSVTAKQEEKNNQLKTLAVMYENMKPKDAARIFDKLDLSVTLELITRMNARKTADILAEMTSEAAQRVTVALARRSGFDQQESGSPDQPSAQQTGAPRELPRIEAKPRGG